MSAIDTHFWKGVALFNRGGFFEAHEEMEEAMNLLEDDTSDWDFYRGMLRASVANHKLGQNEIASAQLHLRAALKFLEPYPDRHRGIRLGDFRNALASQLSRLEDGSTGIKPPRVELAR
jgi:predicted metal-dependent hydrolase